MRYEKIDGNTHIYLSDGEDERNVLRDIAKASFELAKPVGRGLLHYNTTTIMTDEMADTLISLPPNSFGECLEMDYVEGRQCKTFLKRIEPGRFELNNYMFERDRGSPDAMLDRATIIQLSDTVLTEFWDEKE